VADRFGRKRDMIGAVVIFVLGSAIQAGAVNIAMLFVGKLDDNAAREPNTKYF